MSRMRWANRATVSGIAATAIIGLVLAGCGSGSAAGTSGAGSEPGSASGGGSGSGSGEETVTQLVIPTNVSPWTESYQKVIADYEKESGIKVVLKTFPMKGLSTKQINDVKNQSHIFDIYQMNEFMTAPFYDSKWVQPLKEIDPDFTWPEHLMHFAGIGEWDAEARKTKVGAEAYAVPVMGIIQSFVYRKDLYEQLGLTVPDTWEQALANGKKAMDAGAVKYGYCLRAKPPTFDFTAYLNSYDGNWFTDDWEPAIDTEAGKKALTMFVELSKLGADAPQTIGQAEEISLMQSGQCLQANMVTDVARDLEDPNTSSVVGKIGYAVLPGKTPHTGAWALGVPAGLSKARSEAALDFLKWLTSKKAQEAWTEYGGLPTRDDIETDRPEIKLTESSGEYLVAPARYTFAVKMRESTDRYLAEAVAGQISVDEALKAMQEDLREVVVDAGYLEK